MGKRIVAAVRSGDVVTLHRHAGSANLQPRIEGAEKAIKESGAPIKLTTIATGAAGIGREIGDRSLLDRPSDHEGHVRRRRRRHRETWRE